LVLFQLLVVGGVGQQLGFVHVYFGIQIGKHSAALVFNDFQVSVFPAQHDIHQSCFDVGVVQHNAAFLFIGFLSIYFMRQLGELLYLGFQLAGLVIFLNNALHQFFRGEGGGVVTFPFLEVA
jgi:hypothetical protein